jgi:hypothetical protein
MNQPGHDGTLQLYLTNDVTKLTWLRVNDDGAVVEVSSRIGLSSSAVFGQVSAGFVELQLPTHM